MTTLTEAQLDALQELTTALLDATETARGIRKGGLFEDSPEAKRVFGAAWTLERRLRDAWVEFSQRCVGAPASDVADEGWRGECCYAPNVSVTYMLSEGTSILHCNVCGNEHTEALVFGPTRDAR